MQMLNTTFGAILAASAALTAFGLSAAEPEAPSVPMQCQISASEDGYGYRFDAVLRALEPIAGTYEFHLESTDNGRAVIRQAGTFSLKAGETELLSQATMNSRPDQVEADLILSVDGTRYACGIQTDI